MFGKNIGLKQVHNTRCLSHLKMRGLGSIRCNVVYYITVWIKADTAGLESVRGFLIYVWEGIIRMKKVLADVAMDLSFII